MRAFVTGATGFVGGNLARLLVSQGVEVAALCRSAPSPYLEDLPIRWVQGDLLDPACPLAEAMRGCDWVFHVAALYSTDPTQAPQMYEANVGGAKRLLAAAWQAGVGRVVHTSTVGTLGRRDDSLPPDEEVPFNLWATASPYVRSKYLGEVAALEWAGRGLPLMVVHPCAPVGPGDAKPTSTGQRLLDALHGRQPSFVGGGINFVSVRDVAWGHYLAARHGTPGRRYILGHLDGNLRREAFVQLVAQVSGQPIPEPTRPGWRARLGQLRSSLQPRPAGGSLRPAALTADPHRAVAELGMPQTALA
ncbi:MAG: NAD-dependent epimerase/dehydratase family protein, partial [Chloroflexi bacterium]|nr:NAD-dependent epimerase/dehydratase family protein [Chloroflexota bacterium]